MSVVRRRLYNGNTLLKGLEHLWKFDGNADDSVGGAHGTLMNAPTLVTGKLGNAYSFNGVDQHITMPDAVKMSPSLTVLYWAKSNVATWDNYGIVASARVANGFLCHGKVNSKGVSLYVYDSSGANGPEASPDTPNDIQTWHLYGFMYNHAEAMFYPVLDGKISVGGVKSMTVPRVSDTIPLTLIKDPATNNFGNLALDNFAIWNRILSEEELRYYYNSGAGREII